MRPDILNTYSPSLAGRLKLFLLEVVLGKAAADPAKAALYRPTFFSSPYYQWQHHVMHSSTEWSRAEMELFAAHTASKIECRFCVAAHSAFAAHAGKSHLWVEKMLEPNSSHLYGDRMNLILIFLSKLIEQPWDMTRQDILHLRAEGISQKAIEEAAMVAILFSVGGRLSSSLGFSIPSPGALRRVAPVILKFGYKLFS